MDMWQEVLSELGIKNFVKMISIIKPKKAQDILNWLFSHKSVTKSILSRGTGIEWSNLWWHLDRLQTIKLITVDIYKLVELTELAKKIVPHLKELGEEIE